jgi:DNA-binding response OmpR family regulator
MKTIANIVVFDNDACLLALLKGYCYANNIALQSYDFELESIKEVERHIPVIVVIPIESLAAENTNNSLETALLKRVGANEQVKIFGLMKNLAGIVPPSLAGWLDVIVNSPFDIRELDRYLKNNCLLNNGVIERRTHGERRAYIERRGGEFKHNGCPILNGSAINQEAPSLAYLHDAGNPESKDLYIDHRKKCLFLKGQKVDLTPKEFELVELLATDADRIFTAEEIIKHLWPCSHRATKSDLYQYMHLLRKKIENDPDNPQWIMTVKGFGYKLNVDNPDRIAING